MDQCNCDVDKTPAHPPTTPADSITAQEKCDKTIDDEEEMKVYFNFFPISLWVTPISFFRLWLPFQKKKLFRKSRDSIARY